MTELGRGTLQTERIARAWLLLLLVCMPLWMGGTGDAARVVLVLSGLLLPVLLLIGNRQRVVPFGLTPLLLFCAWLLIQAIPLPPAVSHLVAPGYSQLIDQGLWSLAPHVWRPLSLNPDATLREFFRYLAYAGLFLSTVILLADFSFLQRMLKYLAWFFGIYAFIGLVQFFIPGKQVLWLFADWPERTSHHFATFVNGNHYASLIGMVFPLLVVTAVSSFPSPGFGTWRERLSDLFTDTELGQALVVVLVAILAMVSVFFSLSRGGTLSLFGSCVVLLSLLGINRSLRGSVLIFVGVLICSIGLLVLFGWDPLMDRFAQLFYETGGLQDQRLIYWLDSLHLFQSAPLVGSGAGTFVDAYPPWQTAITKGLLVDHAHNDYLELLTDLGLMGVILVASFWWQLGRNTFSAWRKRRSQQARLISIGCLAGLAGILLHSFTDFNLEIPANGLYLFFLFAVLVVASNNSSRTRRAKLPVLGELQRRLLIAIWGGALIMFLCFSAGNMAADHAFAAVSDLNLQTASGDELQEFTRRALQASRFAPACQHYLFAAGVAVAVQGDLECASDLLVRGLARKPLETEVLQQIARIQFSRGDATSAQGLLHGALHAAPKNWAVRKEYVDYLLTVGQPAAAIELYKEGLEVRPDKIHEVLESLILHGVERSEMSAALPDNSALWAVYGEFQQQMGSPGAAEQAYRRGVRIAEKEIEPGPAVFWKYLKLLDQSKRNAEALELTRKALGLFPGNQHFLARQGVLYQAEGLRDRAIEAFRSSLMVDPRQDWVRNRLEKLEATRP